MMAPVRVALVDDEPLARHKLRRFFEPLADFAIAGEAGDGPSALRLLEAERPQLVLLDIHLPGLSGLEVLRRARPAAVIFTTAFDRYALRAFELAAVDYLLKPFSRERFLAALERARRWLTAAPAEPAPERLAAVGARDHLVRLFVRDGEAVLPLAVPAVEHCEADDDAVIVHASGRRYRLNVTLSDLEARLDPASFLRIHRRLIVNLDHVAAMVPVAGGRFEVRLRGGASLPVSRQRSRLLRGRGI